MNSTANRLYTVILLVAATYGISRLVQAETEPPETEMPAWTFHDLPMQLGKWHGEDTKMDPKIATATGAEIIADRLYRDETGATVSMHTAMFRDPSDGVIHTPLNCYRGNGWTLVKETREDVPISEGLTISVALTTWEKDGERVMVGYWYQLGENVLYDRFDLGNIRWKMPGKATWPVLIKVMLQVSVTSDPDDAKTLELGFAELIAKWLNQPEHQKYLAKWPSV
jgi:EpsI family protein